jgi:hypothetical protein
MTLDRKSKNMLRNNKILTAPVTLVYDVDLASRHERDRISSRMSVDLESSIFVDV